MRTVVATTILRHLARAQSTPGSWEADVGQHNNSNAAHKPLCLWQWYATGPLQAHSRELFVDCI